MIQERRLQIDGLRALAMIGVLYVHFWDKDPMTEDLRVSLFFVVSGFLITHILWTAKQSGERLHVLNFYARRALRLFPALAVLVIVGVTFDIDGFRTVWPWHLFQASNIYFAWSQSVTPWVAGHLWSLNVLEQFYLIWPIVIFYLSLRQIYVVTIGLMVTGMFLHTHGGQFGIDGWWRFFVIPFDPILAGALTYLLARHVEFTAVMSSTWTMVVAAVVILSPVYLWNGFSDSDTYRLIAQPALCAIVLGAFVGFRGPVGWALQSRAAVFLSKISYGVYMYHLVVWWFVFPEYFVSGPRTFFVMSTLTVIVATVSWYVLEEPLSRLKSRIPTSS